MSSIDKLIGDLEAATEGSRELDMDIARVCGAKGQGNYVVRYPGDKEFDQRCPHYTTSLTDALSLVPDDWAWIVEDTKGQGCGPGREGIGACVWDTSYAPPIYRAETPELALCIAALKARRKRDEQHRLGDQDRHLDR